MKKQNDNLILITGSEEYLRTVRREEILASLGPKKSMNYHYFDSPEPDLMEIRRLIDTVPFMEDTRRIVLKDSGILGKTLPGGVSKDELLAVFTDIPESSYVIFDEAETSASNPLTKLIKKEGRVYTFDSAAGQKGTDKRRSESQIRAFAAETLRKEGKEADARTLDYLLELCGYDMRNLSTELEKLLCYTLDCPNGYRISEKDIDSVCSRTLSDRVFQMTDSCLRDRTGEALALLEELFALKTPPMKVLFLLRRQFEQAFKVKDCIEQGMKDRDILALTELKDWQLRRLREQLRGVSTSGLRAVLELTADMEYSVKTGDISDRLAVELIVMNGINSQ